MRVNRRFLYWGILLVAIGGVLVAADVRAVDTATLTDALRLWPLAVVAIGLSIVLRKTDFSLPALAFAAAIPGLVVGGALAVGPRFAGDCGARGEPVSAAPAQGTFDGPATVAVWSGCGSINVRTATGNTWRLDAGNTSGRTPRVDSAARSLSIGAMSDTDSSFLDAGRDAWDLTLPTSEIDSLSLIVTAGHGQIDLADARVGALALTVNAAEIVVDASAASIAELSAVTNVGSLSMRLPANSDLVGSFRVGAGELRLCAPPGLGLRVSTTGVARHVTVAGLHETGSYWENPEFGSAPHRAYLNVKVSFGTVRINPIGGCR
jgi:hypothetical protein